MAERKCTPNVRFSQYDRNWIEHAVGELLIERVELSPQSNDYPLMAFVANQGIVPKGERYDRSALITDTENKLYKKTELGDFIYSSNNLESGSIGLNNYGKATISPVYSIFSPTEIGVSSFLGRRLVRSDFIREMVKWRQGVVYGQWRIHESDFERIIVKVPSVDEQAKIGSFLNWIDNLLLDRQRMLDKLYGVRASMLEKMFPKDDAKIPEIRFKGFSDVWKDYSFSRITYPSGTKNKDNIQYESYSITNEMGFAPQSEQFENGGTMKNADKRMYIIVEPNSFAYNPARINVGSIGYQYLDHNVIVSSLYEVFKTTDNCYDRFLWYWFKTKTFSKMIEQLQEGGVRLCFYYDKLCMCSIKMPDMAEQIQIAEYFEKLDKLISSCSKELNKLQSLKKGLLEKMFV